MDETVAAAASSHPAHVGWKDLPRSERLRLGGLALYVGVITLLFGRSLGRLVLYASQSGLFSYIPLVPLIAGYVLYIHPKRRVAAYDSSPGGAVLISTIGVAALAGTLALRGALSVNDDLALVTLAYVSFLWAGGFLFLGGKWMAAAAFPAAFLIFLVPLPDRAVYGLEKASAIASAEAAAVFLKMSGTPLFREGMLLGLPGITLEVAQECSGIRSSWVLFITSLVASHLFLGRPWRRVVLVLFVFPLAIVRNGFRIFVIGLLCVHIGPHMIDSFIHRRGGPIFFALSLVPLLLLLAILRRREQRASLTTTQPCSI